MRTLKTAAAVIISMLIVNIYGTTDSRLIFSVLGAMAAVQTTFKDSLESSLTQIVGVLFGAALSVVLLLLPLPNLILAGMGIISWLTGWLLVLAGVGVDLIIFMAIIVHNAKYFMYKQEDEE
jgi:uncharacterized membrane protein YgaE (UPF0421/DUF939 family)